MKWFKHQSNARNDERLARLEDKTGLEGYGFYFKMLEIVAEIIDSTDRCEVTYSMSRWARQVNITTKKFLFLSQCCDDVGLMLVQRVNDDITVNIPNLLKYRDNHTKNLQAACKQEVEEDKEEEIEKEEEKQPTKPTAPKPARFDPRELQVPAGLRADKWDEWVSYRMKVGKRPTKETWVKQLENITGWIAQGLDPCESIDASIGNGWQGLFAPKGRGSGPPYESAKDRGRREVFEVLCGGKRNEPVANERDIAGFAERVD